MASTPTRRVVIALRTDEHRLALLDGASKAAGQNRSEFILDAAVREATTVLFERRRFELDAPAFSRFVAALDAVPSENPRLSALLTRKAPWEQ